MSEHIAKLVPISSALCIPYTPSTQQSDLRSPFNLADIDAFLHHLPQRAHIPQPVDNADDALHNEIDLCLGSESSDTEAEGRVSHVFCSAESAEDI